MALARRNWRLERKAQFEHIEMNPVPSQENLMKIFLKLITPLYEGDGWEEMHDKNGIKVYFKDAPLLTISEERMCCMRGELLVRAEPKDVFETLVNLQSRL